MRDGVLFMDSRECSNAVIEIFERWQGGKFALI